MRRLNTGAVLLATALAVATLAAKASDPVGVYAVVEKVAFEPASGTPERIQVWGAFAFDSGTSSDDYDQPQLGYLYYSIAPGAGRVTQAEWEDLKAVAGTGQGVGFGKRYQPKGRVRKAGEKPATPDLYPIGFGMVRMGTLHMQPAIVTQLKAALKAR